MSADVIYVGICDEINILVIYLFSGFGFFVFGKFNVWASSEY